MCLKTLYLTIYLVYAELREQLINLMDQSRAPKSCLVRIIIESINVKRLFMQPEVLLLMFYILQPPVKHPGWSGILKAFSVENMCMQYSFIKNKIAGSEDCLYLNIFVPQVCIRKIIP